VHAPLAALLPRDEQLVPPLLQRAVELAPRALRLAALDQVAARLARVVHAAQDRVRAARELDVPVAAGEEDEGGRGGVDGALRRGGVLDEQQVRLDAECKGEDEKVEHGPQAEGAGGAEQ